MYEWYLTTTKNPDKPVSLPKDCAIKNLVLHGTLVKSSPEGSNTNPIHIQVSLNGTYWAVSREHERRGIWILSKSSPANEHDVWYWLKEPHSTKQASLHEPIRAYMGLLSNIVDLLSPPISSEEAKDDERYKQWKQDCEHARTHLDSTLKQVYDMLACSNDEEFLSFQYEYSDANIFQEPFDYELLHEPGGLAFVRLHLGPHAVTGECWLDGFAASQFWKSLKSLKAKTQRRRWTNERFRASAEAAEKRSQRLPWGEPLSRRELVHLNWNMTAKVCQGGKMNQAKSHKRLKAIDGSVGGDAKRARRDFDGDNDDTIETDMMMRSHASALGGRDGNEKANGKLGLLAGTLYSDERMRQALVRLTFSCSACCHCFDRLSLFRRHVRPLTLLVRLYRNNSRKHWCRLRRLKPGNGMMLSKLSFASKTSRLLRRLWR